MLDTDLWIKATHALKKQKKQGFSIFASPSPSVEPSSHSVLSLTAIVSGTIKSRRRKILQHLSWAHSTHTHVQWHTRSTHQDKSCYYWSMGWCVRRRTNTDAWQQKVFLSLESCNCVASPGQRPVLRDVKRSIQLHVTERPALLDGFTCSRPLMQPLMDLNHSIITQNSWN